MRNRNSAAMTPVTQTTLILLVLLSSTDDLFPRLCVDVRTGVGGGLEKRYLQANFAQTHFSSYKYQPGAERERGREIL